MKMRGIFLGLTCIMLLAGSITAATAEEKSAGAEEIEKAINVLKEINSIPEKAISGFCGGRTSWSRCVNNQG